MKYIIVFLLILSSSQFAHASDYWITSNNADVFYNKEWQQLPKITPKIKVFKFYYQVIQRMPTAELRHTLEFLKENNIKVAVEVPGLTWEDHGKGYAIEGYGPSFFHKDIANRFKAAGGVIDYIAIDEVIYFGHFSKAPNTPNIDVKDIAKEAYDNTKVYYSYFPNIKIGFIEPFSQIYSEDKLHSVDDFVKTFNELSSHKLSFIHYDVLWGSNLPQVSMKVSEIARKYKMNYGVIFNDNSNAPSDKWISNARSHIRQYFSSGAETPDDIIIQSWNLSPKVNFSTTEKDAMSSLVPFVSTYLNKG